MARLPRFYVKDVVQHVILRGNNRDPIFGANDDYLFFLESLSKAREQHALAIHAYVLMTNHVHMLVTPDHESSLSKTIQSLGRRYVQYFNYSYKRTGTLWEGRYRATVIDSEQYLLTCMRYIEVNPVRANMVKHPSDYAWSSYRANALGEMNELIDPHLIYRRLGKTEQERQRAYRQLFRTYLSKADVDAIGEATYKGWALGNDRFRDKVEKLSSRRAAPLPKGRPKKAE